MTLSTCPNDCQYSLLFAIMSDVNFLCLFTSLAILSSANSRSSLPRYSACRRRCSRKRVFCSISSRNSCLMKSSAGRRYRRWNSRGSRWSCACFLRYWRTRSACFPLRNWRNGAAAQSPGGWFATISPAWRIYMPRGCTTVCSTRILVRYSTVYRKTAVRPEWHLQQ